MSPEEIKDIRDGDEYVRYFYKCNGVCLILFQLFTWSQIYYASVIEHLNFIDSQILRYLFALFYTFFTVSAIRSLYFGRTTSNDATLIPEYSIKKISRTEDPENNGNVQGNTNNSTEMQQSTGSKNERYC